MINTQLLEQHLAWCEQRELRPNYVRTRRLVVEMIEREIGRPIELADESDMKAWYASLSSDTSERRSVKPGTRAAYLSHARSFYEWLIREHLRDDNPTTRLSRPRLQRRLPRPIADADLTRAVTEAPDRVRPWLLLAALMGLRACEIANLRAEDINRDLNALIILEGKGGKQRVMPVHPLVAAELERLPQSGWLFPHWSAPGPVKPHNVSHRCAAYLHGIGVAATLHQLRHHFGTSVYRASRDLRLTQELMGHASPQTTAGYAAWSTERASAVIEGLAIPA